VHRLEAAVPEDLLRVQSPPMADWLEGFLAMRVHVLIRFGRWDDILALPMPADALLYCVTTAMLHYARGVALSATGRTDEAEVERELFRHAAAQVPDTRTLFNNTCADILTIASAMLDGELDYRKGDHEAAFAALRRSIELDDNLPYDEPWGWMQPTRHAYGALLLEQGLVAEAEAVYRADLGLDDTLPRPPAHPRRRTYRSRRPASAVRTPRWAPHPATGAVPGSNESVFEKPSARGTHSLKWSTASLPRLALVRLTRGGTRDEVHG